jgi:sensor histidine kinase YesM
MKTETARITSIRLNDIAFRLIVIPLCGIAIPLLTHMIEPAQMPHGRLKLAFLFSIGIAWVIFEGNKYLHGTLRSYFDWHNKPYQKIFALLLAIPFYTIPASVILLVIWYRIFHAGAVDWVVIKQATLIIMLAVVFIVHIYETVFLVKEAESEMVHRAEVERAKMQAELDALKNQIDPHFMFNSLNTLSYLIDRHPDKAARFNDHLADVYRYILSRKSSDLVLLAEEIAFLEDYYALIRIRFDQAVNLTIDVPDAIREQFLVPPISLQIPAENAFKHNEFSNEHPLHVSLTYHPDHTLIFSNQLVAKKQMRASSHIGLENLNNRYQLLTGKQIDVRTQGNRFEVILPVVLI